MGKGVITANINGEGLYTIDYIYNAQAILDRIAALDKNLQIIEKIDRPQIEASISIQTQVWYEAKQALDLAIGLGEPEEVIYEKTANMNEEWRKIQELETTLANTIVQMVSIENTISHLKSKAIEKKSVSAWCTDYSINIPIGTVVGTMEFPGEGPDVKKPVIIQPGTTSDANFEYDASRDGILTQGYALTAARVFYTLAILPGWQRWTPLYRLATIASVDKEADTVNFHFQNIKSSYHGLDTIPTGEIYQTDIPVDYMGINADAFVAGDNVVVAITSTGELTYSYKVIGFEKEPRVVGYETRLTLIASLNGRPIISGASLNMDGNVPVPQDEVIVLASEQRGIAAQAWLGIGEWEPAEDLPAYISGILSQDYMDSLPYGKFLNYMAIKMFRDDGFDTPSEFKIETRNVGEDWALHRNIINWRDTEVFYGLNGTQTFGRGADYSPQYVIQMKMTESSMGSDTEDWAQFTLTIKDKEGGTLYSGLKNVTVGNIFSGLFQLGGGLPEIDPEEVGSYVITPQGPPTSNPYPVSWECRALVRSTGIYTFGDMVYIHTQTDAMSNWDPKEFEFVEV